MVVAPYNNYQILAATDTYLEVTMRQREDIVGLPFLLVAFPDKDIPYERNPVKLSLDKALQTKQVDYLDVIRYDLELPQAAGGGYQTRYWEASHTPVLDEAGKVEYLIQHTSDVTARELAKQAHKDSEDKFKFMTEAVPEVIEQGFIQILDKVYRSGETFVAERGRIHLDRFNTGQLEEVFLTFTYQPLFEEDKVKGILVFGYEVTQEVIYRQKLKALGIPLED